jgi:hypothetical protein
MGSTANINGVRETGSVVMIGLLTVEVTAGLGHALGGVDILEIALLLET